MKNSLALFLLFMLFSCNLSTPDKSIYEPFVCLVHPENRTYMPEEIITIGFNFEINPDTIDGVKVTELPTETKLSVKAQKKSIIIEPPLPPESKLLISIDQSLKSVDNKPLMVGEEFSEKKETLNFEITTGPKLAEVAEIIPDDTRSATIGVLFDNKVKLDFQKISPKPVDLLQFGDWIVFSFDKIQNSVVMNDVLSVKRDEKISEIRVELSENTPDSDKLEYDHVVSDNSVSVSIKDDSAIAAKLENTATICPKKCTISLNNLEPESDYVFTLTVLTTTGIKKESIRFTTEPEKPHIMISEIMHSPLNEPEKSWEFVEIYNNGSMNFDLSSCFIDDKNDSKGKDPLEAADGDSNLILKAGETAVITGNEATFGDLSVLWLIVDDTTIADAGLTGSESVQIICENNGVENIEAQADPSTVDTEKGYSVNYDSDGHSCSSEEKGGTPGEYYECM